MLGSPTDVASKPEAHQNLPTDGASKPEAQQNLTVPLGATQNKSEQRKL